MELFGYTIKRKEKKEIEDTSFLSNDVLNDDGIDVPLGSGHLSNIDIHVSLTDQANAINYYRTMAQNSDVDFAICEIIDGAVTVDSDHDAVSIVVDNIDLSDKIKDKITAEFETVIDLLDFNNNVYDIAKQFYIDGQLNYQKVVDIDKETSKKKGIKRLSYLDPRGIKKVKETEDVMDPETRVMKTKVVREYYVYTTEFIKDKKTKRLKKQQALTLEKDSIVHINSGLINIENNVIQSFLHKAIKPLNNLTNVEDSTIIYRLGRAAEKRAFYIDVGNMPKTKAEAYMKSLASRYNTKLDYDKDTGIVSSNKKTANVVQDYWLPRRGSNGTEIDTIQGAQNLSDIEDIIYFQKKLFRSLNVPPSRMDSDSSAIFGKVAEITRDELKFSKFIHRFRNKLSGLLLNVLGDQLILKMIMKAEEWDEIKNKILFKFTDDSYLTEQKEDDLLQSRLANLSDAENFVGEYFDKAWVYKNILHFTEEEIKSFDFNSGDGSEEDSDDEDDDDDDFDEKRQ